MQLRVLGPLELVDDDATTIPLGGAQMRRALATLALHAPSSTPVDVLNEVLWPDGAPSTNALQATVSKLRKAIAPISIDAAASAYGLVLGQAQIDAHRFETLTSTGRDAAADGRHEAAVEQLDSAMALWRGRPFDDLADLPIGQAPAARLLSLRDAAITTRLECNLGLGRLDLAAAELEALVVSEPFVERWWALLMLTRYRQNRQADALRAYQQSRTILAEELGLEPGPELRELEGRILRQDPSLLPASPATTVRPARTPAARTSMLPVRLMSFVGRSRHIDALSFLLDQERLITVLGPGGAGKTSLSIEVAKRAATAQAPRRVMLIELAALPRGGDVMAAVSAVLSPGNGELRTGAAPSNELD
ncbi:MAG TPA: BTAD domain-containing putative transcriptional regulator, partial [Ilumatobacteraceae bacterium]|nr:BTAD domain-containing putative transcriptional regulator [Ilumatobacteraceae bacterium]